MISNILTNKSIWKILMLYSYSKGAGFNWTELKKQTQLHIASLKNALEILEFYKIIKKEKRIIKLDFQNHLTNQLLDLIEDEKKRLNFPSYELYFALNLFLEEIQKNKNKSKIKEIYLFGSYAKKKASINSDIDIAIISDDINLRFNKEIIKLEQILNKEFQIIVLNKLGNDDLSNEIKMHGIRIL